MGIKEKSRGAKMNIAEIIIVGVVIIFWGLLAVFIGSGIKIDKKGEENKNLLIRGKQK